MRRGEHFPKPQMTRAANRTAFTMWLNGCSDAALDSADPASLARSYGLPADEIARSIDGQKVTRRLRA
jgi:hypothetical protein